MYININVYVAIHHLFDRTRITCSPVTGGAAAVVVPTPIYIYIYIYINIYIYI